MYKKVILLLLFASAIFAQIEDHVFRCGLEPEEGISKSSLKKTMITGNYNITYILCVENGQSTHFSSDYISTIPQIEDYFSTVSYGDITIDNVEVLVDTENPDGSVEAFELSGLLSSSTAAAIFCVPEAMVEEVLDSADSIYNFSDFDYDADGTVDMLIFMVARYELYDTNGVRKGSTGAPGLPGSLVYTTLDTTAGGTNIIIDGSGYRSTSGDNAMVQRARATNADDITGISVHELGHGWFNFPDVDHYNTDHFDHWAFGGFDEMTDGRGFRHRASLYNPAFRLASDWGNANLTEITSSQTITLSDYDETGDIYFYDIPDHAGTSVGGQRIYLTGYTKPASVRWQDYWPLPESSGNEKGLMIWRENRNLNLYSTNAFRNALYPPVDIEVAHGKWQWDNIDLSDPAPADRRPINTNIEDPLLGRDSLEAYYSYYYLAFNGYDGGGNPTYVGEAVYDDWRVGSESCFFTPFSSSKEYAFYTNPNSCAQRSVDFARSVASDFKLENIRVSNNDIRVDVKIGSAANIILQNVTLAVGEWNFYNNVTIASGVTLTIQEGTELIFENNAKLIVNGTLDANGTSGNEVVFDFVAQNLTIKNGIIVNSGASASFDYAEIKNGYYGIYSYIDPNIDDCEISDCYYGIYIKNAGSGGNIYDCNIHDNTYAGIYLNSSSPTIRYCDIKDNGHHGVRCYYYSSPKFGYYQSGYNDISYNGIGVSAFLYSNPLLGNHYTYQARYNKFYYNDDYHIKSDLYCSVKAEDNYWVPFAASEFYETLGGTIDYEPHLTFVPFKMSAQLAQDNNDFKVNDKTVSELNSNLTEGYDPEWPIKTKLEFASYQIYLKKAEDALTICKDVVSNNPDSVESFYAMDLIREASEQLNDNSAELFFYTLSNKKENKDLYGIAGLLYANYKSESKSQLVNTLFDRYEGTIVAETIYHQKILNAFHDLNNNELTENLLKEFEMQYPKSLLLADVLEQINSFSSDRKQANIGKQDEKESTIEIPHEYALIGNYPNPFNPSTKIKYATPFTSNVSLEIYDITGRLVKSFEVISQNSGHHEFLWDGTNIAGSKTASGIYIYKFRAVSLEGNGKIFEKTAKLLLMK